MLSFDIMTAAKAAYRTVWDERSYLFRLGLVPFTLIYINFLVVALMGDTITPLRNGLLLFPAMLAEGWLISQFIRTLLTGERWPMPPVDETNIPPARMRRARGLFSGMIVYVLINLALNAYAGVIGTLYKDGSLEAMIKDGSAIYSLISLLTLFIGVYGFRAFWLYIPMVVNFPPMLYLRLFSGLPLSLQMIGLWIATILPALLVMSLVISTLYPLSELQGAPGFVGLLVFKFLDAFSQTLLSLLASTAMVMAIGPFLFPKFTRKDA